RDRAHDVRIERRRLRGGVGNAGRRKRAIGRAGNLAVQIGLLALLPPLEAATDGLAQVAALQRAGEIAENGAAVAVEHGAEIGLLRRTAEDVAEQSAAGAEGIVGKNTSH